MAESQQKKSAAAETAWGRKGEEKFTGNIFNVILLLRGKFGLLVIFSESVQVVLCGQALTAAMCLGETV